MIHAHAQFTQFELGSTSTLQKCQGVEKTFQGLSFGRQILNTKSQINCPFTLS